MRLGIVGCGAIARGMHIPTVMATEGVSLTALVDTDRELCDELARQHGVTTTAMSVGEIAGAVDGVIVATPPDVRTHVAISALSHGMHVLCEKPLANTSRECDSIIEAARQAGRVLAVGHMYRFHPVRRHLHEILAGHELGEIRQIVATEGKPYDWPTRTGYTFRREMVAGGVLINAGIHTLDSILWWMGDPVEFTYEDDSLGGLESNVRVALRFEGGSTATFRQSRTCRLPFSIRLRCEHGELDFGTTSVVDYSVTRAGLSAQFRYLSSLRDWDACRKAQLVDFVQAVAVGRSPLVDGEEGSRVVRLVERLYSEKRSRSAPAVLPQPGLTW